MLVCVFANNNCTRDRGCSAHPVFPAPSFCLRAEIDAKLGRIAPREYGRVPSRCLTIESQNSLARRPGTVSTSERRSGTHTALCPRYNAMDDAIFAKLTSVAMGPCFRRDDAERSLRQDVVRYPDGALAKSGADLTPFPDCAIGRRVAPTRWFAATENLLTRLGIPNVEFSQRAGDHKIIVVQHQR